MHPGFNNLNPIYYHSVQTMGLKHYVMDTPQSFTGNLRGAFQGLGKGGATNAVQNVFRRFTNELSTIGQDMKLR